MSRNDTTLSVPQNASECLRWPIYPYIIIYIYYTYIYPHIYPMIPPKNYGFIPVSSFIYDVRPAGLAWPPLRSSQLSGSLDRQEQTTASRWPSRSKGNLSHQRNHRIFVGTKSIDFTKISMKSDIQNHIFKIITKI
jgi:hypothetical protein